MTEIVNKLSQWLGLWTGWGRKESNMKNRYFLQIFAEGEGSGSVAESGDATGTASEEVQNEPLSFDDFLKLEGNQAEFDRRIQKAINTAVSNAQKKWETLTDDKVSEAEKLAQMTGEQKEKYRADKAEKELADLKQQIALGDMAKTARKMLSDENISIPDEIVMNLVCDDAEKTKSAVEGFAKSFKDAVQTEIKNQLKGGTPKTGSRDTGITKKQIMAIKDPIERQKMIAKHLELFERQV